VSSDKRKKKLSTEKLSTEFIATEALPPDGTEERLTT
jgi:hypothetical protein